MSKKPKKTGKPFKYEPTSTLPKLGKIKTEWDFKALYYKNDKDPQIEADLKKTITAYKHFAKRYRGSDFATSTKTLTKALVDLTRLAAMPETSKPGRYFGFRHAVNANDDVAEKQLALISERLTKAGNELLFFELELGKISKADQKKLLNDTTLQPFHYYLSRVFLEAKHNLSEAEERILNLTAGPASGMWVAATEKIISNRSIVYKKESIPINEALERLNSLPSKEKPTFWRLVLSELEQISEVAEHELNAVITTKKTEDELRHFSLPYSETVLSYEDDQKSIEALVAAVSTKGFALSRKFYKAKATFHGVPTLDYSQKYDSIGETPVITFDQAVDICRDVFYGLKTEYGQIFDNMLVNGQIDVYPRKGKRGGAFMSDSVNLPTKVFLNHTNDIRSLQTLAHEMGHAIHGERSKTQSPLYQGHSITTAETASTLFENFVFKKFYEQANASQKIVLLHERVAQNIATIQRQIACFNYELELHNRIRTEGSLTRIEMRDLMQKHLKAYVGEGVTVSPEDGYSYVYWSHIRYGFYVYTYTFGILMSNVMAEKYYQDPNYIEQIDSFLCAGKSDTVANIFKAIGIQTNKISSFEAGLKQLENDVYTFSNLVNQKK